MSSETRQLELKIASTMDETALLLDHLYKFPQKQREILCQCIQALKQNLTLLRVHIKSTNIFQCEKRYQQLFLQFTSLKNEIMTGQQNQISKPVNLKKKQQLITLMGHRQGKENHRAITYNHEQIMEAVVKKEEECVGYKQKIAVLEGELEDYKQKSEYVKSEFKEFENHLRELNQINLELERENRRLVSQQEAANQRNIKQQSLFNTHKEQIEFHNYEQMKLKETVRALEEQLRIRVQEVESCNALISSIEQKHQYEIRDLMNKYQFVEMRERSSETAIKQMRQSLSLHVQNRQKYEQQKQQNRKLAGQISTLLFSQQEDKNIIAESQAIIKKLIADKQQLKVDNQSLMEKIERYEEHLETAKARRETDRDVIELEIRTAIERSQVEHRQIIDDLQERIFQLNHTVDRCQRENEQMAEMHKEELNAIQRLIKVKQEDYKTVSVQNRELIKDNENLMADAQALKFVMQEKNVLIKKLELKQQQILSLNKLKHQLQAQLSQSRQAILQIQNESNQRARQISDERKRLLRAKVQTLHEVRSAII